MLIKSSIENFCLYNKKHLRNQRKLVFYRIMHHDSDLIKCWCCDWEILLSNHPWIKPNMWGKIIDKCCVKKVVITTTGGVQLCLYQPWKLIFLLEMSSLKLLWFCLSPFWFFDSWTQIIFRSVTLKSLQICHFPVANLVLWVLSGENYIQVVAGQMIKSTFYFSLVLLVPLTSVII